MGAAAGAGCARMAGRSEVAGEALGVPQTSATVCSSSTAICSCLGSEAGSVGNLVSCPLPAQSNHWGDGEGAAAACRPVDGAGAFQSAVTLGDLSFGLSCVRAEHGRSVCVVGIVAPPRRGGGSVLECGEGCHCLIVEGIGMDACPPPRFSGADHASEAGLGCGLSLASDPHPLPGL